MEETQSTEPFKSAIASFWEMSQKILHAAVEEIERLLGDENTMSSSVYTAYSWLSDKKLGTSNARAAVTQLNNRLSSVCTYMKNAGITPPYSMLPI